MLDMGTMREAFDASTDFTVGHRGGVRDPRSRHVLPGPPVRGAEGGRGVRRGARGVGCRRADPVRDRDPVGTRRGPGRRPRPPARGPRAAVPRGRRPKRAVGSHGHPPLEPVAGAADHRHRALPARGARPAVRGLAQQHLQRPRARGGARGRPCGGRVRPPSGPAARAAGALVELAVPRRPRFRPPLGPQPDLHEELPPLRHSRGVRELPRLRGLRGLPRANELDRGAHPALVERPAPSRVRHRGGPHLRRADHGRGLQRAGGPDRGLGGPGGHRVRRGSALRAAGRAPDRGELLAGDPPRAGRQADRPRPSGGVSGRGDRGPPHGLDRARPRRSRHGGGPAAGERRAAPAAGTGRRGLDRGGLPRRGGRHAAHVRWGEGGAGERPAAARRAPQRGAAARGAGPASGGGRGPPHRRDPGEPRRAAPDRAGGEGPGPGPEAASRPFAPCSRCARRRRPRPSGTRWPSCR